MNAIRCSGEPAGDADSRLVRAFFRAGIVAGGAEARREHDCKAAEQVGQVFLGTLITKESPLFKPDGSDEDVLLREGSLDNYLVSG
jgi:hypothetical protein